MAQVVDVPVKDLQPGDCVRIGHHEFVVEQRPGVPFFADGTMRLKALELPYMLCVPEGAVVPTVRAS